MKVKNILLSGICLMSGLFSACTSEDLIDGDKTQGGIDTSISIVLTTGDPATKAPATNYQYATEDEIKVSNCVVAVFKMNGDAVGDMIGGVKSFTFTSSDATTSEGKPAYTLNDIPAKTGKVRILVVANATNSDYSGFTTWSQFENATIQKELVENDLVKVGSLDIDLVPPVIGTITIPLSQLSAKVKLNIATSDPAWSYTISGITVDQINKESDLYLIDPNKQEDFAALTLSNTENSKWFDAKSFYTYENPLKNPVKVTIKGTLSEQGGKSEEKIYSFELNKTIDGARLAQGLCHGTLYDITGKIDVTTRSIDFTWSILPWSTTIREVSVDIIKPKFLVVKDTEMTMPNSTSISTEFNSSSPITISNKKVSNGSNYSNIICNITPDGGDNGNIRITSDLPINFAPKYISFTVTNEDGLSQDVKIEQYPPLYITANTSTRKPTGNNNQNNDQLYQIKTLVADFSILSTNKNDYELNEAGFTHSGTLSDRQANALKYVNDIRGNAKCGYPLTEPGTFSGKTNVSNSENTYNNVKANSTVEGEENNYRISPNFILASQNGINTISDNGNAKINCALYFESVKNADGTTTEYKQGTWRMATRSELMLIDILQNTTRCEVKKILEGSTYMNALPGKLDMMDPRITSTAVRCVRDIK